MEQQLPRRRIFYFCPDFPQPSGGTRTLYRHVHRLCEAGIDAAIVHQRRNFVLQWHSYPAPVIWLEDRPRFEGDDILVFPEVMPDLIRQTQSFAGTRVVIALSWLPSYAQLRPGERWQDYGIQQALTTSPAIRRHLMWNQEIDVTLVPEHIDPERYSYQPHAKALQIAYLTRKDASGAWLEGVYTRKHEALSAFTCIHLRNID